MPRAVVVVITCDFPQCDEPAADELQDRLALNKQEVMLDLCETHIEELRMAIDPFLQNGQRPPKVSPTVSGDNRGRAGQCPHGCEPPAGRDRFTNVSTHLRAVHGQTLTEARQAMGQTPRGAAISGEGERCPIENTLYKDKESLRKHADRVHGLTMKELMAGVAPKKHPEVHPVDSEHPLECPECHGGFAKPQGLAAHRRLTHGVAGKSSKAA